MKSVWELMIKMCQRSFFALNADIDVRIKTIVL